MSRKLDVAFIGAGCRIEMHELCEISESCECRCHLGTGGDRV